MARERGDFGGGWRPVSEVGPVREGPSCPVIFHAGIAMPELGADPEELTLAVRLLDLHASP